jgi:fructose-bisphosphate aldolase class II
MNLAQVSSAFNNMEWKKNNKTLQILTAAEKGQYGVVAPIA